MGFVQEVLDCEDHESCIAIVGLLDDSEVWVSHWDAAVHPEHRLNIDAPDATDRRGGGTKKMRWALACDDCLAGLHWTGEDRRRLALAAAAKGVQPAEVLARAAGVSIDELVDEGIKRGWEGAAHVRGLRTPGPKAGGPS